MSGTPFLGPATSTRSVQHAVVDPEHQALTSGTHFARGWFAASLVGVLALGAGTVLALDAALPECDRPAAFGVPIAATMASAALLLASRQGVRIQSTQAWWSIADVATVEEETDVVSVSAVRRLILAAGALCVLLSFLALRLLSVLSQLPEAALNWSLATFYASGVSARI